MYDIYYEKAPKEITEMCKKQYIERGRSKGKFVMVRPRTEYARKSVRH